MTARIFDTETTSLNDDREIIEASWIPVKVIEDLSGPSDRLPVHIGTALDRDAAHVQRYKPSGKITLGSMAVHHILPHELEGCPPSSSCALPADTTYIVGHNVDFDWEAIGKPNVKRICTDAMARYVWPDVDSYSQSALLYHVFGADPVTRERLRNAHSAQHDVENNVLLLDHILLNVPQPITTWTELHAYSEACRIPRVMPIGDKQGLKGLTLDDAYRTDPGFIGWCLRQDWIDDYFRAGLEQAIRRVDGDRRRA